VLQAKGELRQHIYAIEQMLLEGEKQAWSIAIEFDRKRMTKRFAVIQAELTQLKGCIV
jgi:hypothetical protein